MYLVRYNPSSPIYIRYLFFNNNLYGAHDWDLTGNLCDAERFPDLDSARTAIRRFCERTELLHSNCEVMQLEFKVIERGV